MTVSYLTTFYPVPRQRSHFLLPFATPALPTPHLSILPSQHAFVSEGKHAYLLQVRDLNFSQCFTFRIAIVHPLPC